MESVQVEESRCVSRFEDPAAGPLAVGVVELSAERAILGETLPLTESAYVDVKLDTPHGAKLTLYAQVVVRQTQSAAPDAESSPAEDTSDTDSVAENAPSDAEPGEGENPADPPEASSSGGNEEVATPAERSFALRWIHSDPLGESIVEQFIQKHIVDPPPVVEQPVTVVAEPPAESEKSTVGGVLLIVDQDAPARIEIADARRNFKFSHLVQGDEPRDEPRAEPQAVAPAETPPSVVHREPEPEDEVSATIRRRAKTVRASDLAARHDVVRVLNESAVRQLIQEAVTEAVGEGGGLISEEERRRLLEEAEEGFKERLEAFKAEKAGLEQQTSVLGKQLKKAQRLLEEERQRVVSADQFTVSDAGLVQLEQRLGRIVDHSVAKGGLDPDAESEMRRVLFELLDDEREKISEKAQGAQSDKIALLERKVGRLAHSLDETAKERDSAQKRAQALEAAGGGGLRNVFTSSLDEDPNKSRKKELLRDIFNQNKEMREHLQKKRGAAGDAASAPSAVMKTETESESALTPA